MPEQWDSINTEIGATKDALKGHGEALDAIQDSLLGIIAAQHEVGRVTLTANKGFQGIAKTVKGLAGDIFGIATNVLKMGAAGLGLGIIGSGFGFDALAGAALNRQRNSNSLGLTPGQLSSFQINAQQFLGTDALQSAAGVQLDPRNSGYLASLGIGYDKARNESASDLAFQMLQAAVKGWKSNPRMPLNTKEMIAYQALGGHVEDVRNATMDPNFDRDIRNVQRATNADAGALGFDRETAAEWITLKKALDSAGVTIESGLIKALAPLAPQIAILSKEFTGLLASFLSGDNLKVVVADVKDGLHNLGDFVQGIKWNEIGTDVQAFGTAIHIVASTLGFIINGAKKPNSPAEKAAADAQQANWGTVNHQAVKDAKDWFNANKGGKFGLAGGALNLLRENAQIAWRSMFGKDYDPQNIHASNVFAEKANNLPGGMMDRLAMDESGYGKNLISPAGALGTYQFMPDTAKEYGIDPLDTKAASGAAGKMLASLFKKYGAWDKAIAAYNWGDGNLDKDIAKHGKDWLKYAPAETQGEVSNVVGHGGGSMDQSIAKALNSHAKALTRSTATKPVKLVVYNSTQARVAVSANAAIG